MHESPLVVYAGSYLGVRGSRFPAHQHSTWELVYYRRGRVRAPVGDKVHDAHPGVLLATPPRTIHSEYALTTYENLYVGIDASVEHPWPARSDDDADQSIGRVMAALVREQGAASRHADGLVQVLATELDLLLRRAGRRAKPAADAALVQARRLLDEGYATGVRVGDVAARVGLSTSALREGFTRIHGASPRDYLQGVRLRHALDHLYHSSLTLDTIARLAGYHSASHLSRHVKAATGASPGQLRRAGSSQPGV